MRWIPSGYGTLLIFNNISITCRLFVLMDIDLPSAVREQPANQPTGLTIRFARSAYCRFLSAIIISLSLSRATKDSSICLFCFFIHIYLQSRHVFVYVLMNLRERERVKVLVLCEFAYHLTLFSFLSLTLISIYLLFIDIFNKQKKICTHFLFFVFFFFVLLLMIIFLLLIYFFIHTRACSSISIDRPFI